MNILRMGLPAAWRVGTGIALMSFGLSCAQTADVNLSYLDGKDPVAPDAVTAYGPDLFGDRVNLFNGALEFEHTDLSLPGNDKLPVALVRRHTPGQPKSVRGQFGDWDLHVPRIGGSFSMGGWITTNGGVSRCSGFSLPPVVYAAAGTGADRLPPSQSATSARAGSPPGLAPPAASVTPGAATPTAVVGFIASDYWRNTSLYIPGHGSKEVLVRNANYGAAPADGGTYPLLTHDNWQIGCLPSVQNAPGEGFVALSPEGVRYRFDWMATRLQTGVKKSGARIGRQDVFLMATQVSDRFGNWVRYTFDPANPLLLTRIDASDGRAIVVTNVGGRAVSATDGTRTYAYSYNAESHLTGVQLPDGSRWTFNLAPLVPLDITILGENANCDQPGDFPGGVLTGTITHPSGAVGSFTIGQTLFGRTYVDRVCNYVLNSKTLTTGAVWPRYTFSQALQTKQISGPGLPAMRWDYVYDAPGGWSTCTTAECLRETRIVTVTEPSGDKTRHIFGNRWRVNEGQLLQLDEGWNGSTALKSTTYRYRGSAGQAFPDQFGSSLLKNSDWLSTRHRPQDQRIVTLQSSTFTWQVDPGIGGFDGFARPLLVRKFSSLGYSRTEATAYHDNTSRWVLGQLSRLTELGTGRVVEQHDYDAATAMPIADYSFGWRQRSYVYNPDGTLDTVTDAAGRPTRLLQYRRGKPQLVVYPDGPSESQVVNNLGRPDSRTNAAGTTTSYLYDTMGRVSRVTYPTGDASAYFPTQLVFEQVGYDEYGLAPGHWRQTISTGNSLRQRFFDALWRERLELRYDIANPGGTSSFKETRYDPQGRKAFLSYPERTFSTVDALRNGHTTFHDAIGRVVVERADSELGVLQTSTTYPANAFQRIVTNPRQFTTGYAFQAFDTPGEDSITQIWAPEGVSVAIVRDVFGKPTSITRSGGTAQATRSYAYDGYQRLCKTVEPETGATVQDYDLAGNLAWRASGLALPGLSSCDQAAVPAQRKVSFGYDARNRLISTNYGDGSPGVSRSYTPDGLPWTINTPSFAWTLGYNNRRLLVSEGLATPLGAYGFAYGIDSHGNVASMSYPNGPTVSYFPDALGRPTQISGYASGIWHHPNGALGGYSAANGVVHSVSQNVRGLPALWSHAGVVQDQYAYDANGNVTAIADLQEGVSSRSMGYDGMDRLTAANGIWGLGQYGYDALDNLVSSRVGPRVLSHNIDPATNRLASLTGSMNIGLGYDANGNITQRGAQGFQFDIGNRMAAATGVASYVYDGHGRRSWVQTASGRTVLRIYGQSGRLLFTKDSLKGETRHIHLGDKVVAETNSLTGTRWLHTDALGSPVAATGGGGAVLERTRYEPYGATAAGTNPDGIGFTGHVNDAETGLVYMQQRYYEPVAGRFLSVDPVTTDAKTGDHFNRYLYAAGNPYLFIDPDGRNPDQPYKGMSLTVQNFSLGANILAASIDGGHGQKFEQAAKSGDGLAAVGHAAAAMAHTAATVVGGVGTLGAKAVTGLAAKAVTNAVPSTLARVIPQGVPAATLGRPGASDVFVTAAEDIAGMSSRQIAERLAIAEGPSGFRVIEFSTPRSGFASPVFRTDPGFVGGGRTAGGAREFVIPNGPIPADAIIRTVP